MLPWLAINSCSLAQTLSTENVDLILNSVETHVLMRSLSANDCKRYWNTGEPLDKAGGYAIQGLGSTFIEKIDGSFSNVVGPT